MRFSGFFGQPSAHIRILKYNQNDGSDLALGLAVSRRNFEYFNIPHYLISCFGHSVLSRNELTSVNTKAFQQLKSLTTLDLSYNKLQKVFKINKNDLKNIATLKLRGNEIEQIHNGAFEQVPGLVTLDLNENNLTGIAPTAFQSLQSLQNL